MALKLPKLPLHHPDRVAYSVAEYAQLVGKSCSAIYAQIYEGKLRSVKLGGSRLIPRSVMVEAGLIA